MADGKLIEFAPQPEDGAPKITRSKSIRSACDHQAQLIIDEETQLVECKKCGGHMSAFNALMLYVNRWERMHYDVTEWKKMQAQRELDQRLYHVRSLARQLQWVETPPDGEEPARSYWLRYKELSGEEPYAMFRRGRQPHVQYCFVSKGGTSWTDAKTAIMWAERAAAKEAAPGHAEGA